MIAFKSEIFTKIIKTKFKYVNLCLKLILSAKNIKNDEILIVNLINVKKYNVLELFSGALC